MKRMLSPFTLALSALSLAVPAWAQPPGDDPIGQNLFPPELVMSHQAEIGLQEAQARSMKESIHQLQAKVLDAQWEMQAESQKMIRLLQARPVDEVGVLAQADRVMALERDVKRAHLSLLIRIKNQLTEPQQAKLMELRKQDPGRDRR